MTKEKYAELVKERSKDSRIAIDCAKAFVIGGAICTIGQGILELFLYLDFEEDTAKTLTSVSLIFIGVLLTALHQYERLAKHGGAGTLVPITGFANAMSSPAIEFKAEGLITGLAAKMFVIAGPVLVYGTSAAVLYGIIYYVIEKTSLL
ncbi:MAG: stage V sporulation protein AC [Ruminococcus sp.]|nr:stage V sporulation protein AC [Ruminococcus sp.]MBQ4238335.1 stage V sporulation protein AC [Ruminococcus sp.]